MRTKEWLKLARKNISLTQKELAEIAKLSIQTIRDIEQGTSRGSKETWEAIETAFDSLSRDIVVLDQHGNKHTFEIKGDERPLLEMIKIANDNGYDLNIVIDYLKNVAEFWHDVISEQHDIINGPEAQKYDSNLLAMLEELIPHFLRFDFMAKYFEAWLGSKKQH